MTPHSETHALPAPAAARSRRPDGRRISRRAMAAFLVLVMILGALMLWIGVPFLWIWGVSQLEHTTQPTWSAYSAMIIGIPVTMGIVYRFLLLVGYAHARLTGGVPEDKRVHAAWMRSMRGERDSGRQITVLDRIMIITVTLAVIVSMIWFFFFAHVTLPA